MNVATINNNFNHQNNSQRAASNTNHIKSDRTNPQINNEHPSSGTSISSSTTTKVTKYSHKGYRDFIFLYIRQFCDVSSLHGLKFIAEPGRPFFERLFWLSALILVSYGMVTTIESQVTNYLSNPILMSLNSKPVSSYDVPFPAITICPEHQTPVSLFNISELLSEAKFRELTVEEKSQLLYTRLLCLDSNSNQIKYPNITTGPGFHAIGFLNTIKLCQKVMKDVTWKTIPEDDPCSEMQITIGLLGFCFSFNMFPPQAMYTDKFNEDVATQNLGFFWDYRYKYLMRTSSWYPDTGYKTDINEIENEEVEIPYRLPSVSLADCASFIADGLVDEIQEECTPRSNGFLVFVHSPCETPSLQHSLVYAVVDERTIIHTTQNLVRTDNNLRYFSPTDRGCYYNHERKLMFFKTYTHINCDLECEANLTRTRCNCNQPYQPRFSTTPLCKPEEIMCYRRSVVESNAVSGNRAASLSACNCLPACNELTYDVKTTVLKRNWTHNSYNLYHIKPNDNKVGSLANIVVMLASKKVNCVVRAGTISASDFIANIGGLMGLFLGFSFVSFFEIFYFSSIRWLSDIYRRRKYIRKWKKINNGLKNKDDSSPFSHWDFLIGELNSNRTTIVTQQYFH